MLVTDMTDDAGNRVVVVDELSTHGFVGGENVNVNKTITAYPRETAASDIRRAAADGRLLALDKKRSPDIDSGRKGANSPTAISNAELKNNISMKDYYAAAYGAEDRDGDGKISQDEKTRAIRAMDLTQEQKAALWQLVTGSSTPNSNPFGSRTGKEVYDRLHPADTGETEETEGEEEKSGPRWENGRLVLPKYGESRVLPRG